MRTMRIGFFSAVLCASLALQGCIINMPPLFGGERGPVEKHVVVPAERFWTINEIAVIDLTGVVSIEGAQGWFGVGEPGMLVNLKDRLLAAEKNSQLRAVILRIDSPGGGVTASDLIHHEILKFKEKTKIPVIAMMQDVAASGGLYIAMAADKIYAMPTTITGSIGVITTLPSFEGLGEKIGVQMRVIKSGEHKDLGSPWRDLSDSEKQIFQGMIDRMYGQFTDIILASRGSKGLTKDKLKAVADGRVLSGKEAAEAGLIDGVAYLDDVIEETKKLAGVSDATVISYEYPYAYRGNIYASSSSPRPRMGGMGGIGAGDINLFKMDLGLGELMPRDARFMYLWLP